MTTHFGQCNHGICEAPAIVKLLAVFPAKDRTGQGLIVQCEPCLDHLDEAFATVGNTIREIVAGTGDAAAAAATLERQAETQHVERFGV